MTTDQTIVGQSSGPGTLKVHAHHFDSVQIGGTSFRNIYSPWVRFPSTPADYSVSISGGLAARGSRLRAAQ